ncbi:MAG: hypothetical protein AAGM67_20830 [Bacteroidota bacterium]
MFSSDIVAALRDLSSRENPVSVIFGLVKDMKEVKDITFNVFPSELAPEDELIGYSIQTKIMKGFQEINFNDYVSVQLTDVGRNQVKKYLEGLGLDVSEHYPQIVKEDEEGWSDWQFWYLMSVFGPIIGLGLKEPFSSAVRFEI